MKDPPGCTQSQWMQDSIVNEGRNGGFWWIKVACQSVRAPLTGKLHVVANAVAAFKSSTEQSPVAHANGVVGIPMQSSTSSQMPSLSSISRTIVPSTNANGIDLVSFAVAKPRWDVVATTIHGHGSWFFSIAHAAGVVQSHAIVHVVADAVQIQICRLAHLELLHQRPWSPSMKHLGIHGEREGYDSPQVVTRQ